MVWYISQKFLPKYGVIKVLKMQVIDRNIKVIVDEDLVFH